MKGRFQQISIFATSFVFLTASLGLLIQPVCTITLHADEFSGLQEALAPQESNSSDAGQELKDAQAAQTDYAYSQTPTNKTSSTKKGVLHAEAFVATPDWEFDGFVAGGRDQDIKNMFTVNDLLYLTIGQEQGFASTDRLDIFRRGERMKDPQTGRNMGYEVRKIAVCEITNRIDNNTSSARVLRAYEPVLTGDLIKRAE